MDTVDTYTEVAAELGMVRVDGQPVGVDEEPRLSIQQDADVIWLRRDNAEIPDMIAALRTFAPGTREHVFGVLHAERRYQECSRPKGAAYSIADWRDLMSYYLHKMDEAIATDSLPDAALTELRKIVALGIACFEQHGIPERK